ncbi:MAG: L-glyceraldehyde 3-phosphate reductase [Clostridiales bacterium]|nr:L-glyceraldehyde 3-phosphate reductase [Clostridiales bacterium]
MYQANVKRYDSMVYNRCGNSGLKLSAISLGMWHNFGDESSYANMREMILTSFDLGITHFDLANNYGPGPGSAEGNFGKILASDLASYRDELLISTKAGYRMWDGPYGDWGSKKYLLASLDQSLKRMGLDYVDIFYHHRMDVETPLEETMDTLAGIVRSGKALYVGLSNYSPEKLKEASEMLKERGVPCLIHQHRYSMLERQNEKLNPIIEDAGMGSIAFCPLAQGLLTGKYINGIPADSRAAGNSIFLNEKMITEDIIQKVIQLNEIAKERGQSLSQMALAWALKQGKLTSVIIGASRPGQIVENVKAVEHMDFTEEELKRIEEVLRS